MSTLPGSNVIAKRGAYFCHIGDISLKATYDCCPTTACCGGLGFARQHLSGKGTVFLTAGGVVLTKVLEMGETIVCDTDAIVAYQDTVTVTVAMQDSLCVCLYGGEGCFNTTLTGPGLVVVESMSFIRYKNAVAPPPKAPQGADGQPDPNGGNSA